MNLEKILESKPLKVIAFIVALLVGITRILDIFLVSVMVQQILTVLLIIIAVYFVYLIIKSLSNRFLTRLSQQVVNLIQQETAVSTENSSTESSSAENAYKYLAQRYGIGYDLLQVQWFIRIDGSATLERIVEVEAYSEIEQLDTYLLIPEKFPESVEEQSIKFVAVESLSPGWNVTLTEFRKELRHFSALMTISPPLKRGEKMRYKMVEQLPPGLYAINLTRAEIDERETTYDYCGWNINRPTKKVSLQVEFPEFVRPQVFSSEVRYASASGFASTRLHYEEQQRFRPVLTLSPKGDSYTLRLDVDDPMNGLIYILRWQPPPVDSRPS